MSTVQTVFALLVPLFWGLQYVIIKVGLAAFPPLFFVALRFAAVAAILLPFVGRPTRREVGPMVAISVFFGGLNFGLVFVGLSHHDRCSVSVISRRSVDGSDTVPPPVPLAMLRCRERVPWWWLA